MKATTKFCPPSFICSYRYRFLELKYRRSEQVKGESIVKPARIETVVIFLPDIYSCMPNRAEWEKLQQQYKQACEKFLQDPESDDDVQIISGDDETSQSQVDTEPTNNVGESNVGNNVLESSSGDNKTDDQVPADDAALSSQPVDDSTKGAGEVPASQDEPEGIEESAMPIVILATVISSFFVWIIHKKFPLTIFNPHHTFSSPQKKSHNFLT